MVRVLKLSIPKKSKMFKNRLSGKVIFQKAYQISLTFPFKIFENAIFPTNSKTFIHNTFEDTFKSDTFLSYGCPKLKRNF